jgi:hypothetical protein
MRLGIAVVWIVVAGCGDDAAMTSDAHIDALLADAPRRDVATPPDAGADGPVCRASGDPCGADLDCCNNVCDHCSGTCLSLAECAPRGFCCTVSAQCCSDFCAQGICGVATDGGG